MTTHSDAFLRPEHALDVLRAIKSHVGAAIDTGDKLQNPSREIQAVVGVLYSELNDTIMGVESSTADSVDLILAACSCLTRAQRMFEGDLKRLSALMSIEAENSFQEEERGASRLLTEGAGGGKRRTAKKRVTAASNSEDNVFRKQEGGIWEFRFNGESAQAKDLKGFHYIALLLDRPRHPISASELYPAVNPRPTGTILGEGPDSFESSSAVESIDKEALSEYRTRLAQLDDEMEKEDNEAAKRELQKEHGEVSKLLRSAVDQYGRPRKTNPVTERHRKAVSEAITRALKELKGSLPKLADHLKSQISTGNTLTYKSDSTWITR